MVIQGVREESGATPGSSGGGSPEKRGKTVDFEYLLTHGVLGSKSKEKFIEVTKVFPFDPVEMEREAGVAFSCQEAPGFDRIDAIDPGIFFSRDTETDTSGKIHSLNRLYIASGQGEVLEHSILESSGASPE